MKKTLTPRVVIATLALSLGFAAASSFAMPRGERSEMGPQSNAAHFMMGGKAFAKLHDDLKLDPKQEAEWQKAEAFAKESRQAMQDRHLKAREELKAMLDKPDADLRAVAKRMDDMHEQGEKSRFAVRERWLGFYDTLSAGQKEKVRLFFKDGMERMEQGRRGHEGMRRGDRPMNQPAAVAPAAK